MVVFFVLFCFVLFLLYISTPTNNKQQHKQQQHEKKKKKKADTKGKIHVHACMKNNLSRLSILHTP